MGSSIQLGKRSRGIISLHIGRITPKKASALLFNLNGMFAICQPQFPCHLVLHEMLVTELKYLLLALNLASLQHTGNHHTLITAAV